MIDRMPTGIAGLDEVLGSGLPMNAINLLMGLPGTGKTLLAEQFVFANATEERPALYVTTVSEPFEKVLRYGQELDFFDTDVVGISVFYADVGDTLLAGGLGKALDHLERLLIEHEPALLVIDSFKPLAAFAESESDYRRQLHKLAARLSLRRLTSLWLGEYAGSDMTSAPEFAVADAVLLLASLRQEDREMRALQVLKLRGSDFLSGKHGYRLSNKGVRVFPRLADPTESDSYELDPGKAVTSVEPLDSLVGGGPRPGSATLVIGPPGIGKTVLGLQFVCSGSAGDENSIFATLEENPAQLARTAADFGWSFGDSRVQLMYRSAVGLYLDEWVHELLELIRASDARRVFIDGVANLRAASPDPTRFQEYLYSLIQRCSRQGVNLMMSVESSEMFGLTRLAGDAAVSRMVDNVVSLQFVRHDGEYRRALTMLKSRGARSEPRTREFTISPQGLTLAPHGRAPSRG